MSAAEMREAAVRAAKRRAATHDDDSPAATLAELIALDIAAIPLPDEEGMVERVARARDALERLDRLLTYPVSTEINAQGYAARTLSSKDVGDIVAVIIRPAIRAINGGKP